LKSWLIRSYLTPPFPKQRCCWIKQDGRTLSFESRVKWRGKPADARLVVVEAIKEYGATQHRLNPRETLPCLPYQAKWETMLEMDLPFMAVKLEQLNGFITVQTEN